VTTSTPDPATAAFTLTVTEALWLSIPEVAVNCTVDVALIAAADAERPTCWGVPGVRLGVEGEAVTSAGSPLTVTLIVPENPFRAVAESVTGCTLPPAVRLRLATFAENEKSGVLFAAPPPQPLLNPPLTRIASQHSRNCLATDMT